MKPTSEGNPVKYGLVNQGATCYLNSVLQVLYMTPDFRRAVKRHTGENPDTECIDHHLQTLFDDLEHKIARTEGITKKLDIKQVYEPRDAAECFEKILALTSPTASEIFHGELTHKTACSVCSSKTLANGPFWHLPLTLLESNTKCYSVVGGIKEFFGSSAFTGDNQMYCERCDAKADATIVCEMEHYPEVLMLLLKRFEFNYSYMSYVKMGCTVAIPRTLQIPKNQMYELYAVVNHTGDLRNGHYTATIKDEMGTYNFNDATVKELDDELSQNDEFCSAEAYLLFYRKQKDCKGVFTPPGIPPDISNSVEMREAEDAELVAEQETLTNSKEETGNEDKGNDQDIILGHSNSPAAKSDDEERDETMKKDEEGKTGADEREMESETRTPEIQVDVKVENHKQNTLGDDQRFNQGSNKSNEEQGELGTDVRQSAGQENKTENYLKRRRSQRESQLKPIPKNNEDTVERTHDPKPSASIDGIMNEEESQRDAKCMKTKTSQGCTEMSVQSEDGKREPEPKAKKSKLLRSFDSLRLDESNSHRLKKWRKLSVKKFSRFSSKKHKTNLKKKKRRSCSLVCGVHRNNTSDSE